MLRTAIDLLFGSLNNMSLDLAYNQLLYVDLYNSKPYSSEKIIIKRKPREKEEMLISFYNDKFKKSITSLLQDGQFSKMIKFKTFRNPKEILFYQNIFQYRCILETYNYYKLLNKFPSKKNPTINNLLHHEFMKNLI